MKIRKYVGHKPINGKRLDPIQLISKICNASCNKDYLGALQVNMHTQGLTDAVRHHDNEILFDWLMACFSYQGISDSIADSFIAQNGNATYSGLKQSIDDQVTTCQKLAGFESFRNCGYKKSNATCNSIDFYKSCPVTKINLRKGQLNQAAYSLYFFMRDVCNGDLVGYIDDCLVSSDLPGHPDRVAIMRAALTNELLPIFGIAQKLINMTFADLLLSVDLERTRWTEVGGSMIAIDSLVHNFMHRTGILYHYDAEHALGSACYRKNGCAEIIDRIARQINCSEIDSTHPTYFPRFIQHAIWNYCAESGLAICNGNNIDDAFRCTQLTCLVYPLCGRIALKAK